MRVLSRAGHRGIAASDWLAWRRGEIDLPARPVLFTFDDGYADLVNYALPVLLRYGFRATVFVVAGEIGGSNVWDSEAGAGGHRLMGCDEIRTWTAAGMDVGSHGLTHADMRTLPLERVRDELLRSQTILAPLCGSPPCAFAYPYGHVTPSVAAAAGEIFELAFGIAPGRNRMQTDLLRLHRTPVLSSDTWLDVMLRARLGRSPITELRALVRLRDRVRRLENRDHRRPSRRAERVAPHDQRDGEARHSP